MDIEVPEVDTEERLKVKFNPRTQKLILITKSKEYDNGLKLERFVGLSKKGEAHIEIDDETTLDGLKEAIEEFRAE